MALPVGEGPQNVADPERASLPWREGIGPEMGEMTDRERDAEVRSAAGPCDRVDDEDERDRKEDRVAQGPPGWQEPEVPGQRLVDEVRELRGEHDDADTPPVRGLPAPRSRVSIEECVRDDGVIPREHTSYDQRDRHCNSVSSTPYKPPAPPLSLGPEPFCLVVGRVHGYSIQYGNLLDELAPTDDGFVDGGHSTRSPIPGALRSRDTGVCE